MTFLAADTNMAVDVSRSAITDNAAAQGEGGGVSALGFVRMSVRDSTVSRNRAVVGAGAHFGARVRMRQSSGGR